MINKINSIRNIKYNIAAKSDSKNGNQTNPINKKVVLGALIGLAAAGAASVAIIKKKNASAAIESGKETVEKLAATFKKGIAYDNNGNIFTGTMLKTGANGEQFAIDIKDGIIQQSTKTLKDGTIDWVKKYYRDDYQNKITDVLTPDNEGALAISKRILSGKDKLAIYKGENVVEQYWYNTPEGFQRVDQFIDKSNIKRRQPTQHFYLQNGIQINSFLRDGKFRHPNISQDCIHYEFLDDPKIPEYAKEEVRDLMTSHRYILDTIDELDVLTRTSSTKEPMVVYRNAPKWWVDKAKDGILDDRAFCSTSTVKGASMEGLYIGKDAKDGITYKIHLPKGTPFYDLRHTSEKEMLLPRNGRFRVLSDNELEYILE